MEQISRKDGVVFYGGLACESVNEAYKRFRTDYHEELGKRVYRRLDSRKRVERIHGYKSYYSESRSRYLADKFSGFPRVKGWLMGIVGTSYCHAFGSWYMPEFKNEDDAWDFIDWMLDVNSDAVTIVGRKMKTGRTSKNRKRYR